MDAELLQSFTEEAESYLPTIRNGILACLQDGRLHDGLEISLRQLQTIKSAASMIGLDEIGKIAGKLEKEIKKVLKEKMPLTEDAARDLLDKISQIEAMLMQGHLKTEDFSADFNDFVEASFENLQQNYATKPAESTAGETDEDSWIDAEMMEIFALEADDLLRSINTNLAILEKQPADREALMEIRRNAHTLKGSAGIVGLKELSELAHRVEDMLDYLAEKNIGADEKVLELLLTSTDFLSALTVDEKPQQSAEKIAHLYQDFDEITALLETRAALSFAVTPSAEKSAATESDRNKAGQSQTSAAAPRNRSIVRVSLEKLDDLVKIVSGLVVSRSVFEQRLAEFDRQIEELNLSTRRLQRSSNKLETDFEAGMLGGNSIYQPRFGFPVKRFGPSTARESQEFDTLEFDRYTDFHQITRELIETTNDTSAINSALDGLRGNLETLFDNQHRLIEEMQDKLLRIRMVNVDSLSMRLNRTVRVTCEEEGKQADLFIEGENLEVDTQILDSLLEPLLHLLRNAVAHGIETAEMRRLLGKPEKGRITLRVNNEGTHIVMAISDDGRGITASALKERAVENGFISREDADLMSEDEAFELVFLQGLTTAEKLSQTAGRGVGMNVVRTAIERQQGTISIDSEPQKGTTFTLRLPMSLAVTRALLVKVNTQAFALPLKLVRQIGEVSAENLEKVEREKSLSIGDIKYALSHLNGLLGLSVRHAKGKSVPLLLLENLDKPYALMVDEIIKPEEIVIKPLGAPLQNMPELLGATILGDGSIVPVLDLFYLLNHKKPKVKNRQSADGAAEPKVRTQVNVMIIDDSPSVRHMTSNIIRNAGFQPHVAKDGQEALEVLQSTDELPDIILTDVEMPRMDGYELLSALKRQENLQQIPVVMITSRASDKHRLKAFELGVSEYLVKPFDDVRLIETINILLSF